MTTQTILKSIEMNVPKETVWEVLTNDRLNRIWYNEFSKGCYAITDWQVGSKAIFKDESHNGMIGKVIVNRPGEILSIAYEGILRGEVEDYESEEAKSVKGGRETYKLVEENGVTTLMVECDMADEYFDYMSGLWDKAMEKIKETAEQI